uniref:Uncharacterized protein n=1 Tax=Strigamia maritima TaxID=126957 RepID=T1J589_STRMM
MQLLVHPTSVSYHLKYDADLTLQFFDEMETDATIWIPIKYLLTTTVQKCINSVSILKKYWRKRFLQV